MTNNEKTKQKAPHSMDQNTQPTQATQTHTPRVLAAREFARLAHLGQAYGNNDYTVHLDLVACVAKIAGGDEDMLIACYLHDTVEDTPVSVEEIKQKFGELTANLVWRVTNEAGHNRKERAQKTYPKIRASEGAILLKLCDRYANTMACMIDKPSLFKMYKKEYPAFREALHVSGMHENIWQVLDRLYSL